MFHCVQGTPFDQDSGAYDNLTLWEQIDQGYQYTPAKKYLTSLPIGLYVVCAHAGFCYRPIIPTTTPGFSGST